MSQDASGNADRPALSAGGGAAGATVQGFTPLPTNARIGELVVQSLLGAGEFAITYATEHTKRSKRYALKEYFPRAICRREAGVVRPDEQHAAAYAWGLDRFLSEAKALQQIRHPALIEVLGVTQHGGTGYAGMAYESGRDLDIWLHEQRRIAAQEELDRILAPILEGLAKAHAAKVFHFDLGPSCIIIRDNGTPVIVDFGVFRVGLRRRLPHARPETQIYTAPELLATAGGPIGPWTDIYSLAGLLYLAVSGKPPLSAVARAAGAAMPTAVAAAQGRYRRQFLEAIDTGLSLAPAQRPRSLPDWSKALLGPSGSRFGLSLFSWKGLSRARPASGGDGMAASPPAPLHTAGGQDLKKATDSPAPAVTGPAAGHVTPPPTHAPTAGNMQSAKDARRQATADEAGPELDLLGPTEPAARSTSPARRSRSARALVFGIAGLLGGALAGALASVLIGTLLRSECPAEGCIAPLVLPLAAIFAVIGVWEGIRYAGKSNDGYEL
jgi:hypothetical protein